MTRRPPTSIVASPVLIGSITTLVVIVAVFLAYNANNGLPFVPTRDVTVLVPNAAELVRGNEVREGGFRVGIVTDLKPAKLADGTAGAQLSVKLDKSVGRIPRDSHWTVRPRSLLGLKYLDFERGAGSGDVQDGHVFAVSQGGASVDLDRLYQIFDAKTRAGGRMALNGLGDAFSGRGTDLNQTIAVLPPLFGHLAPVARNLADRGTDFAGFFKAIDNTVQVVAPVAATNAHLFTTMADTFGAIARDPRALEDTIAKSPPTLAVSTHALAVQRPFLDHTAAFSRDLNGAAAELRPTLPPLNAALEAGPPVLRRSTSLDSELQKTFDTLHDVVTDPATNIALRALTATIESLNTQLRFLGPYVTVCNYWTRFWTDVSDHFSQLVPGGNAQRALLNSVGNQNDSPGNMGAAVPANGEGYQEASRPRGDPVYFHGQPYGAAIDSRGNADCEAGQRGYPNRLAETAPPRFHIVANPQTPGNQGPTFTGRAHVPPGETYTSQPQNEPQMNRIQRP